MMSKLLTIVYGLKGTLIMASAALARGDMMSAILISLVFNLVETGMRPVGQTVRNGMTVTQSDDRGC